MGSVFGLGAPATIGFGAVVLLLIGGLLAAPPSRRWLGRQLDTVLVDVRLGVRGLAARPGLACLAILPLSVGIGASVTVFSMVDAFVLRGLPYEQPDRLVEVGGMVPKRGWSYTVQSIPDFLDIRDQSRSLDVAGYSGGGVNLSGMGQPERVQGRRVSWNLFEVLGVQPALGRAFQPAEERAGDSQVVIVSAEFWRRRFAGDEGAVGRTLLLDGVPHTVIGVLPDGFWFEGTDVDVWTPLGLTGDEPRSSRWFNSLGRLRAGYGLPEARAEVAEIAGRLARAYPKTNEGWSAGVRPLRESVFGPQVHMISLVSAMAVGFVLLIACANAANLLLARAAEREHEIAVRGALGASRWRLTRQVLTEAAVTVALAGGLGTLLATFGVDLLVWLLPPGLPGAGTIAIHGRALAFALATTAVTGLAFGAVPALRSAGPELTSALKTGGRGGVAGRARLSQVLVVGEVSLALTLLVCCALLIQGLSRLERTRWGWDPENVLTFHLSLPEARYSTEESTAAFYERLRSDLRALPGVEAAGGIEILPLQGESNTYYNVVGQVGQEVPDEQRAVVSTRAVLPGYFEAMRIPLLAGEPVRVGEDPDSRRVVVNETLARRHWPDGDAVGQHLVFWRETFEIVGVVGETLEFGRESRPMAFVSAAVDTERDMSLVVRSAVPPQALTASIRSTVARLDPGLPIYDVATMSELMERKNGAYVMMPRLMAGLAGVALVLGLVGVYGVMARSVSQRTQEVGVRMALGAKHSDVLALVMRQGATLVGAGVMLGLIVSGLAARSLALFLFGVSPTHVPTYALIALALLGAGLIATFVPARRATLVDPVTALRNE